jgi:hypothetical protein
MFIFSAKLLIPMTNKTRKHTLLDFNIMSTQLYYLTSTVLAENDGITPPALKRTTGHDPRTIHPSSSLTSHLLKRHLKVILQSISSYLNLTLFRRFTLQNFPFLLCLTFISTNPVYLNVLDFITLAVLGGLYKSQSSLLFNI